MHAAHTDSEADFIFGLGFVDGFGDVGRAEFGGEPIASPLGVKEGTVGDLCKLRVRGNICVNR